MDKLRELPHDVNVAEPWHRQSLMALDYADDLVARVGETDRHKVRIAVWGVAAVTYALLDISASVRDAGKRKR